ncbi:hypothetical protein [uncultured Alistipes sp.]|jgi:hypothetical protein|uniref:hypothetical protein n=1 Tax=uncultured Alistipes sp. TaxID=538949 RepID=UPI0025F5326E|nr:hypothetical protein [uncultured Alistipes sp.]
MKKIILAALAVSALFSCSKENNGPGNGSGERAMLNISITSPTGMRASGTVPGDAPEDGVSNFTVFVTEGETVYTGYSANGAALSTATSNAITASTTADHIYVVANSGNLSSKISSKTALIAFLADLNSSSEGGGNQTSARWASGDIGLTTADFVQNAGGDFVASKEITIKFIAARIVVKVDNQMSGYGGAGSLELEKVVVLNARGQSKLFGTSLIPASYDTGKKFYAGMNGSAFFNWPAAGDYTVVASLLSDALQTPIASTDTYFYYVFENDATKATAFPTIVTLTGKAADNTELYWPVHLAPYEQWASGSSSVSSVTRGQSYNINIKLTGDATNGGGGTTDPTNPVKDAKVEVSVELTAWNPVTLNKEF